MVPAYRHVVIDEAHEVTARVTQAATDELTAARRPARREALPALGRRLGRGAAAADDLADAGERARRRHRRTARAGRIDQVPEALGDALVLVRDRRPRLPVGVPKEGEADSGRRPDPGAGAGAGGLRDRRADGRCDGSDGRPTCCGSPRAASGSPPRLCVAPLQVWGPMRDKLLRDKTVVMTSATLMLGGDFTAMATSVGLDPAERVRDDEPIGEEAPAPASPACDRRRRDPVAGPGRRVTVRLRAAGHPVRRAAPAAARARRTRARRSWRRSASWWTPPAGGRWGCSRRDGRPRSRPRRSASGSRTSPRSPRATLSCRSWPASSWATRTPACSARSASGRDWTCRVRPASWCSSTGSRSPGPTTRLMSARQRAADRDGRNGFMQVAATHAALLLAQGAGRLIRTVRRPRRGGGAGPPVGDRSVRRLPAREPAPDVADHRSGRGAGGSRPAGGVGLDRGRAAGWLRPGAGPR